jgi:mercuric ion transport protein
MADSAPLSTDHLADGGPGAETGSKIALTGGLLGAIAASSCCVLPLVLTLLGVSGAWMSNLRAMAPYQPYFVALAFAALTYGFYQVYWKPRVACAEDEACAKPLPNRLVKAGLWTGTAITIGAVSFPVWFPWVVPYLP